MIRNIEPAKSNEDITTFEVVDGGTLRMAGFSGAVTRADFYEDEADASGGSPANLVDDMNDCEPLMWAVHSVYSDYRGDI